MHVHKTTCSKESCCLRRSAHGSQRRGELQSGRSFKATYVYLYIYIYICIYVYIYISRHRGDRKFGGCVVGLAWAAISVSQF